MAEADASLEALSSLPMRPTINDSESAGATTSADLLIFLLF